LKFVRREQKGGWLILSKDWFCLYVERDLEDDVATTRWKASATARDDDEMKWERRWSEEDGRSA
jgi:hypothetical protein